MPFLIPALAALVLVSCSHDAPQADATPRPLAVASDTAASSTSGPTADLPSFVPQGWHLKDTAVGSLDGDTLPDAVMVVEQDSALAPSSQDERADPDRRLLVLLARSDGGYRLSVSSDSVMLTAGQGGVMGDPYVGVAIERGAVVLRYFGGSSSKWNLTYRFRLRDGRWILIGATNQGGSARESYTHDWNLSSGVLLIEETYDADTERIWNEADRTQRLFVRPRSPIDVETFSPWSLEPAPDIFF